jgi:hypothetical protein
MGFKPRIGPHWWSGDLVNYSSTKREHILEQQVEAMHGFDSRVPWKLFIDIILPAALWPQG